MKYILIDNDKLIGLGWKAKAAKAGIALSYFESYEEFYKNISNVSFDCKIYIDSDLGNGIKGEEISRNLHFLGFKEIYLTTGYIDFKIENFPWLAGIISKRPPF